MNKRLGCIMLIDDNPADNMYHKIILEDMKIAEKITVVKDGVEALKYLEDNKNSRPDLIFLDINMPKINGWEFLDSYRYLEKDKKPGIIVILTTSQNPDDKEKAKLYPEVVSFESKPLTEEKVLEIVNNFFPTI